MSSALQTEGGTDAAVAAGTMNAWVVRRTGAPEVFEHAVVPRPAPASGHVVIRVAASSVNPVDVKIRDGRYGDLAPPLPAILHFDVAGVVEEVGEGVTGFAPGDEVYGAAGGMAGVQGALADYMLADADLLAHKPRALSMREAAALPLVAITAWEGLRWKAAVNPGDRVLVHGATGGVGHVALQLAKLSGAEVTVTAGSPEKLAAGRALGADHAVNYREETVDAYVARLTGGRGFDLVFDTVGGSTLADSLTAARRNGTVVNISARGTHDLTPMHRKGLTLHVVNMTAPLVTGQDRARHGEILRRVAALVDAGGLRPLVDAARFIFADAAAAHRHAESGAQVGKVVLVHPDWVVRAG
jgi:NADPH2:quinone reductase